MGIKSKKSKAVLSFISLVSGAVILGMNVLVFVLEGFYYDNAGDHFWQRIGYVLEEDYQNVREFGECVSNYLDILLSMSIADEVPEKGLEEKEKTDGNGYGKEELEKLLDAGYDIEELEELLEELEDFGYDVEEWNNWKQENTYAVTDDVAEGLLGWPLEMGIDFPRGYYWDSYMYYGDSPVYYGYEYGSRMDKNEAEQYHNSMKDDRNILYRVENSGNVLFTNEKDLGYESGTARTGWYNYDIDGRIFYLPDGYNFLLYFDGEKVRIWKDGGEINVYGDGYYREGSRWYVPGYKNFETDEAIKNSRIYIAAARNPSIFVRNNFSEMQGEAGYYSRNVFYNMHISIKNEKEAYLRWIYTTILALILLFAAFVFRRERKEAGIVIGEFTGKLWYEIKLFPLVIILCVFLLFVLSFINDLHWMGETYLYEIRDTYIYMPRLWRMAFLFLFAGISFLWLFINDSRYNKKAWKKSIIKHVFSICRALCRTSHLKLPAGRYLARRNIGICLFIWFMCGAGVLLAVGIQEGILTDGMNFLAGMTFLLVIICCPLLFVKSGKRIAEDMDNLTEQIQAVHDGQFREGKEMWEGSGLSKVMENLNDIRNGMNKAVLEQTKSERMKVELVTNVSHDIKTPLTSIISYVELLKQEENLPGHVKEYITILENKSQRLKSMIQDVFEVSKATSGNLPVNMENLDLGKLLRQTIADMEEQIKNSNVSVKTEIPDSAVMIYADGERMYRVFQNLIQNALKYSLDGSRVYITLREDGETAIACVKNTSKEELSSGMDFTERFIRGDESRSDGGSGLGLSIARSFTEACGGSLEIETIADLFVVRVWFERKR